MRGLALRQQRPAICAHQFVTEYDHRFTHSLQPGPHHDFLVVIHRSTVAAFHFGHGDEAAVLALLADPARAAAMGQSGRVRMQERFTWPVIAAKTEAVYEAARLA